MASPVPDLPLWAWNLIIAMQRHEELHGKEDTCLDGVLAAVPADVRTQAEAISGYIQKASDHQLADQAAKNWDDTIERFSRFFGDITKPEAEGEQ
jgi:hypothetical protein